MKLYITEGKYKGELNVGASASNTQALLQTGGQAAALDQVGRSNELHRKGITKKLVVTPT